MKCVYCKTAEVSAEEIDARRKEMWDRFGVIARIIPMCKECRENHGGQQMTIKKVSR